ncbi:ImmA/IrrE family metallo-endopeptidase [Cellvibrio japonicus]|nr:ImmA/IrrE family metallo-endopeptidase [Cellvibrio japonicus]QEI11805.1 ImmA/IrrE family metallo-endopeptidase [Cellvibrio japonicus]QEI15379.1 ImmA/IrrE family metallo-endopeptidase [Cellvibrio japonicus]QEI18958.1 ImmA/IrrE family metallo-endopeptidase [Cellvibrio japonicus]
MSEELSPARWAFNITHILNTVLGPEHFPINVQEVAKELSLQMYRDDPITEIQGKNIPGFEGALFKDPSGQKGWAIFFNNSFQSKGRINFTLAHEFGHYLIHRVRYPNGIQCSESDLVRWDSELGQIEHQANVFAANLLMPLDDYRRQIPDNIKITMEMMDVVTQRYAVSLLAALIRWIDYTSKRAIVVVSRSGFILWAKPSKSAFSSGIFYRTASSPPIEVPANSIAARPADFDIEKAKKGMKHGPGVWFKEPSEEITVFADQYDLTISIIQFAL